MLSSHPGDTLPGPQNAPFFCGGDRRVPTKPMRVGRHLRKMCAEESFRTPDVKNSEAGVIWGLGDTHSCRTGEEKPVLLLDARIECRAFAFGKITV